MHEPTSLPIDPETNRPVVPIDPATGRPVAEDQFNREQAFLLYATFCGDVERTAFALNVRPVDVLRVADEDAWNTKLGNIITLARSKKPGDVERAISRALNYVQAHRLRLLNERVLNRLIVMGAVELDSYFLRPSKTRKLPGGASLSDPKENGHPLSADRELSCRALADLATAIEKAQALTYQALHDTATDRTRRDAKNEGGDVDIQAMHSEIIKALNDTHGSKSPRGMLFDAQLETAKAIQERQGNA